MSDYVLVSKRELEAILLLMLPSQKDAGIHEILANAHLIAAAPELFAALENALEVMEDGHQSNAKAMARAALAKAKGETRQQEGE